MFLYIFALSSSKVKNSLYSVGNVVSFSISKLLKCLGVRAKNNSNGNKPCNAVDAKVFIAYALRDAYKGHDVP